ncbi:hypothetical protein O181_007471 [Austropuccinia psidii MF-1]|uniref:Uncharacterized protein n=1 Tax=Austropuccinia psidii MF-1 TaxID=1389203 RepID=A0A9Q3GHM5_9BASI|nr:hypothetical protein [Austropuccinia psidii MF-1]
MSSSNKNDVSPIDISTLKISNDNSVSQADCQAEVLNHFSLITERIQPLLLLDGSNFNTWSKAVTETCTFFFFNNPDNFNLPDCDTNYWCNLVEL